MKKRWFLAAGLVLGAAVAGLAVLLSWPAGQDIAIDPVPAPAVAFTTLDGAPSSLADFAGRVVVLNIWATWCAPCVAELPSLDRLHQALEPQGLTVVAVSIDRTGAAAVQPFLADHHVGHLEVRLDPDSAVTRAFAARSLPATLVIDRTGRLVARLDRPAEWDSAEARGWIEPYLNQ